MPAITQIKIAASCAASRVLGLHRGTTCLTTSADTVAVVVIMWLLRLLGSLEWRTAEPQSATNSTTMTTTSQMTLAMRSCSNCRLPACPSMCLLSLLLHFVCTLPRPLHLFDSYLTHTTADCTHCQWATVLTDLWPPLNAAPSGRGNIRMAFDDNSQISIDLIC